MNIRGVSISLLAAAALLLTGCTEEKANALYQAAMIFKKQSDAALDAYEQLIVQASLGPEVSAKDQLARYLKTQINDYEKQPKAAQPRWQPSADNLRVALGDEGFREKLDETIADGFHNTRLIHGELSAAFALLPDAAALSAKPVKCSEQLIAQLSNQFADNASLLSQDKIKFVNREAPAVRNLGNAIRNGGDAERQLALNSLVDVLAEEKRLTRDAVEKSLAASETGLKLLQLVGEYDKVSVNDLLNFIGSIASAVEIIDGKGAEERLRARTEAVKSRIGADSRLKRLAARDMNTERISCR
jgi:hypothetical protein